MLTQQNYQEFLDLVTDEITGDWLVVGGALLGLLEKQERITMDIDICPIGEMTNDLRLELMNLAAKCGLPVEAINPAADFFIKQIPHWKTSIVLLKKGQRGAIYRPSIELYFKLKLARFSQTDLQDCLSFLRWHIENKTSFDNKNLLDLVKTESAKHSNANSATLVNAILKFLE